MSIGLFLMSRAKVGASSFSTATILWGAVLALSLGGTSAQAAQGDQPSEGKARNVVPVFRLAGPVTEVPTDDALQMFGPQGTSLRELVARLSKAAEDSAIKAVVILPESEWLG